MLRVFLCFSHHHSRVTSELGVTQILSQVSHCFCSVSVTCLLSRVTLCQHWCYVTLSRSFTLVTIISLLCKSVLCALRLITTHWEFPAALLSTLRCARLSTARLLRSLRSRQCVSVSHPSRALLSFRVPGRKTPGYQKWSCGFFPSFLPPDIGHWIQTAEKPKSRLKRKLSLVRTRSLPAMTSQLWCKHSIQPEQILWSTGLWS